MSYPILLIDIGSTFTKVTAVNMGTESILGTAKAFTTVATDVSEGLKNALSVLGEQTGPIEYRERYACSSAAGGLKMAAVGLVPELTAKAASLAALSAGAKVMKAYSYELCNRDAEEIFNIRPDIMLLTGGTDGGNRKVILHNARVLARIDGDFPVIIAGNRSAADEAAEILTAAGKTVRVCENVMPEFNVLKIDPARSAIREIFLKRIIRAKGLTGVESLVKGILMPTPSAVLQAVTLLATGCKEEKGIGDLMAVDVGGATTDVYSIAEGMPQRDGVQFKGLPEPFEKRTVEGDLGVRYNARSLAETAGYAELGRKCGLEVGSINEIIGIIDKSPDILPNGDERIGMLDYSLASMAVRLGVNRHAGKLETVYTLSGPAFVQTGKDLTGVKMVIGTGGPVINGKNPRGVLQEALFDASDPSLLKPVNPAFMLDGRYILAAMGLLSGKYPETALRLMKKELEMV